MLPSNLPGKFGSFKISLSLYTFSLRGRGVFLKSVFRKNFSGKNVYIYFISLSLSIYIIINVTLYKMKKKIVINENTLRKIIRESIVRLNGAEYFKNNGMKSDTINNDVSLNDKDNEEEQSFTNLKSKNGFTPDMEISDDMEFEPDMENVVSCQDMIDEMDSIHYQNGCPWLIILDAAINKITVCHNFDEFKEFIESELGLDDYCYFSDVNGEPCIQKRYMVRGVSDMGEHYIGQKGENDFKNLLTVFLARQYHKRLKM